VALADDVEGRVPVTVDAPVVPSVLIVAVRVGVGVGFARVGALVAVITTGVVLGASVGLGRD